MEFTKNKCSIIIYTCFFFTNYISYDIIRLGDNKMYKEIYLIRHADQYRNNGMANIIENEQIINEKIILSVKGEKQAEELSKLNELNNIQELWSSNYVGAISTAKYIAYENNIDINIDLNLN